MFGWFSRLRSFGDKVTWLLTLIVTLLAAAQYAPLRKDLPRARTPSPTARLVAQRPLLILMACQLARPCSGRAFHF